MEMASFSLKIRHVFGFTWLTERSIGAGPPVIIQLSEVYYITGGPARHERVSPKTWRRLRHCHDYWSEVSMVIATDQPRSEALNKVLHPPVFTQIFQSFQNLEVFGCF
jgi:hypothetical protein